MKGEKLDCMSSPGLLHYDTMILWMSARRTGVEPCGIPELSPGAEIKQKME